VIYHRTVLAVAIREERLAHRTFLPGWIAHYQGMVYLFRLASLELGVKDAVRLGGARQDHYPAGFTIEAVHDPQRPIPGFE
jgi:hypothetical protein